MGPPSGTPPSEGGYLPDRIVRRAPGEVTLVSGLCNGSGNGEPGTL